ncbi:hypothetical protein [Aquabacterium sp.]|uniref:hypothetical protein n=1 Tax=Aquabacterium sp. TaxID=1872578 RepID=UPI003D6C7C96
MPVDQLDRPRANSAVVESGYSAPYLYLLEDDQTSSAKLQPTAYTKCKLSAVERAIRSGYGQGRGEAFRPWLRIRRNFSSPTSHQVFDSVGIHARNHHFLSKLEFHTALLVSYAGASELRECLPLWPFDHAHPDCGIEGESEAHPTEAMGLIDIARRAGIEHGCFVGTTVPYVASIDLMFRVRRALRWKLVGVSCKPKQITEQSERAQERIELDRLYCASVGAMHIHECGTNFDAELIKQLLWIRPLESELRSHQQTARLADFAAYFDEYSDHRCVSESSIAAGRQIGLSRDCSHLFFRMSAWLHLIDIDLTRRIQMRSRIKRGGMRVIHSLKAQYLGVVHE